MLLVVFLIAYIMVGMWLMIREAHNKTYTIGQLRFTAILWTIASVMQMHLARYKTQPAYVLLAGFTIYSCVCWWWLYLRKLPPRNPGKVTITIWIRFAVHQLSSKQH